MEDYWSSGTGGDLLDSSGGVFPTRSPMVSYGAYKRRAATIRTSISISVARSGHLARQSPVKRPPLRSPAREQRRRGCSSAPSTRRRRPEAEQYGYLTDIDRVERDE